MPKPSPFVTLDRRVRILQARLTQALRLNELVEWLARRIEQRGKTDV